MNHLLRRARLKRGLLCAAAATLAFSLCGSRIASAAYPEGPITIVSPWPAGGAIDVPTRLIADYAAKQWKQQVQVVNKPGASGVIGTLEVMRAKPDGYTLLGDSSGTNGLQQATVKNLPYDITDRTYLARAFVVPYVLLVKADSPWKSLNDVVAAIKKDPESFRFGTIGSSGGITYVMHQFLRAASVDIARSKKVVYQGGPAGAAALAGGHLDFYAFGVSGALPFIQSGKLRAVGIPFPKRIAELPDVPTTGEQGFPGSDKTVWIGITGPKGVPEDVSRKWSSLIEQATKDPQFIESAQRLGIVPMYLGPLEFLKESLKEMQEASQFHK